MAQVAKQAGVHVTTVSLALRNHPSLPPATRQRLQALAERMGYEPDPTLRSLIAYRSQLREPRHHQTLAYLTNWPTREGWKAVPAHADFFVGATAKAARLGYRLEHFWLGEAGFTHRRMSDVLFSRGIQGVVVASQRADCDTPLALEWPRFAGVKIDFFPHDPALHTVTNDQRAMVHLAMRRVRAAGYRRIGFVMPQWWDEIVDLAWSAGFLAEQQRSRSEDRVPIFTYADPAGNYLAPRDRFGAWFRRHEPEAIISYAPFVRPHLEAMGLAVPRDVAFVDVFLAANDAATAGVRQNCQRVGEVAVEVLVGQLQQHVLGLPALPTVTMVEGTWCEGASLPERVMASG
jgi:LacI family transcriptional regulator